MSRNGYLGAFIPIFSILRLAVPELWVTQCDHINRRSIT